MPLNLDILGAGALAAALRNPAVSPRVTIEARSAGALVWSGHVAQVSQTGTTLRVRGYSETIAPTASADFVAIEYGSVSVRGGLSAGDFAILPATPLPGHFLEFILSVASASEPPILNDGEYAKKAKTSAEEAEDSASVALGAKQSAVAAATSAAEDATRAAAAKNQAENSAGEAELAKARALLAALAAEAAITNRGGVRIAADAPPATHATAITENVVWSGDTTQYARVKMANRNDGQWIIPKSSGLLGLGFNYGTLVCSAPGDWQNPGGFCPSTNVPIGEWVDFIVVKTGNAIEVFVNGVSVGVASVPPFFSNAPALAAGIAYINGAQYAELTTFNYALSATERAALLTGEWTPYMLRRGRVLPLGSDFYVIGGPGGMVYTGKDSFSYTANGATDGTVAGIGDMTSRVRRGESVRLRFAASAAGTVSTDASGDPAVAFAHGENVITFTANDSGAPNIFFYLSGDTEITGFIVEVRGCAGRWEPSNCTARRWIDSSGNGCDLVFNLATDITPVAPQPRQLRQVRCVCDMNGPQFVDNAPLPHGWSISKQSTGNLSVAAPGYVDRDAGLVANPTPEVDGIGPLFVSCSGSRDQGISQQIYFSVKDQNATFIDVWLGIVFSWME